MKLMRLEIEQQRAQINIDIQQARIRVDMPERRIEINQTRPEMTTHFEQPDVELNMDALKANIGLQNYDVLTAQAAAAAHAKAQQGIREIVSRTDYVSDVTIPGNKVATLAKDQMLAYQDPDMGHSRVPPEAVEMEGKPGSLSIEWSDYDLSIDLVGENAPEIYLEPPSSVDVEISTRPDVKISVSEVYIPTAAGRNLNTEV
jgi:hypothetical protein